MKQDESNQQYTQLTNTDRETGVQYHTRPLAFKNGVMYIELTLERHKKYDKTFRQMAIQSAVYYRKSDYGFESALAAKICIYTVSNSMTEEDLECGQDLSLDSIIGIMFQDGILN